MIIITCKKAFAQANCRTAFLTAGMSRAETVRFVFSDDWCGLSKTAVFTDGAKTVDVLPPGWDGDTVPIPHEILTTAGRTARVGVYGTNASGVVLPTVWVSLGKVQPAAEPSGDPSTDPTLPVWAQLQEIIGDLADLTTKAKNNLVAAINEAAKTGSGGAGSIDLRTADGYIQYSNDGGATWENLIALAELKGEKGEKGDTGATGPQGEPGERGPQGETGPQGPQGNTGPQGPTGPAGPEGPKGATGPAGPDGAPGKDGSPGKDGADGAPGQDGFSPSASVAETATGATITITDKTGTTTAEIKNGKDGAPGEDGTNGKDGAPGADGAPGTPGTNGTDGKDGTTFTPSVSAAGDLSWTNDGGKANPAPVNLKGPPGADYTLTDADKTEIAAEAAAAIAGTSLPAPASAAVGQIVKIKAVDAAGRITETEAVDLPSGGTIQEVQLTAVVSAQQPLVIDNRAAEQTVVLAWDTPEAKTIPAFTNYYVAKNNIAYPRTFNTNAYTQTWEATKHHGNADAFVSGHKYFCAMEYEMDGDATAKLSSWGNLITPSGTDVISGSGWVYGVAGPVSTAAAYFMLSNTSTGTGTIKHLYCIDVTALLDAGTISSVAIDYLAALFGGLDLVPGENFAGETTSGTATLTIARGETQLSVDSPASTATIKGGDVLSVSAGTVTFVYVTTKITGGDATAKKLWADKKWCAFGDSLTDPTINASTKYHAIIAEKTGISVAVLGKGGTGYYKTKDDGTAYYQRMANCPANADVITIFGSVNDWNAITNGGLTIGDPSDAMSAGTYSGYVNECIDVAISKAPYAQIALVTPMDYHGLPDETLEAIANALLAVAKYRKIKCLDLYHTSGFRVDDATFAQTYTTDYTTTAESYGHPSNVAHERLIAPAFLELLKKMMLYG